MLNNLRQPNILKRSFSTRCWEYQIKSGYLNNNIQSFFNLYVVSFPVLFNALLVVVEGWEKAEVIGNL